MKEKIKRIVISILAWESNKILTKHRPKIIAITGNVGKTTTKDFIFQVLKTPVTQSKISVRAAEKSQNSEFGVCLTILGEKNAWNSFFGWFKILTFGFIKAYLGSSFGKKYPKVLILEVGADHPGDIKHITTFVKPDVVVLTAFQPTPTHGEFFSTIEQHIREKKYLVDALKNDGIIVYNSDDGIMTKMSADVSPERNIKTYSFGKNENANLRILESKNIYDSDNEILGTKVKFESDLINQKVMFELDLFGVLGEANNYTLGAAVLVGIIQGLTLDEIKYRFSPGGWQSAPSRMKILRGINNSRIIDDSYNASPVAVENAMNALNNTFVKGKKIVVLGHMAELGDKSREAHIQQAVNAASIADTIIFSGRYNDFYLEGARQAKFPSDKIFLAKDSTGAIKIIQENNLLKESDLLFVKGSQSARLENVVTEFLFDKRDAQYVCRQDEEWKAR